jgi:hypothetical protein
MNHITVIAHGAPGSFVRRVQEDPTLAVEVKHALARILDWIDAGCDPSHKSIEQARAVLAKVKGGGQ